MKNLMKVLLAVVLAAALLCGLSLADEVPEAEGGKKFNSTWAIQGMTVQIMYEEEGYRVLIDSIGENEGIVWEYSCYYQADQDALVSVASSKMPYALDPETLDPISDEVEYEGFDDESTATVFTINDQGRLIWKDGHENAGADLEFANIGNFEGVWVNEEEQVEVEILWNGTSDDDFFYTVFIMRGTDDAFTSFVMNGVYNEETGKLECLGSATSYTRNEEGTLDAVEDGETYDAFFSFTEEGTLLFETANGIELEYASESVSNG